MSLARKTFTELTARTDVIPDAALDTFWTTLEPASIDFMIGEWRGGEFHTGHRSNGFMKKLNWFGKTFVSASDAKPLVCLDRGEVTASMVYDGAPVHDHFKKVDDNAVMGIMNGKGAVDVSSGSRRHLYFYLERV
jgi:hypothetical protein